MVERVYRSFWLGCLVLGFAGPVCPVYAAELHWSAPEGCPDVHALERETEQVLGEPLANYPLNVVASVTQTAAQLSLSLRITFPANAETRERELQATSCQELLEAAAVAIALAAAESGERATPAGVPQNTEPAEPTPRAAPVDVVEAATSTIELGAAGTSLWGALPQLGLGGELQLAWIRSWLRLGLAATWFPVRSMQVTDDVRASFGMYSAQLLVCGHYNLARARWFGCATGTLGRMNAHLDGPTARTESTAWRALGVRFGVSYPILPPLELTASLAATAPLTRPTFHAGPGASALLHQPGPLNAQVLLGVLFSL